MKVCPQCGKNYPETTTLCTADGQVLQQVDDPLLGQTLAEKYAIEKLIKRGGMGAVYRGKHVLMDKTVAIKVLRPSLAADEGVVARFSREARAASRISHPHAVSVTDFGEAENGVVFLVMEYLDGRTLKEIIRSEGPLSLDRAVEIVRQVSGALDAAHSQGVVHRDLKSDNIMLVRHNGDEWAKVLDFGIAKIKQPEGSRDVDLTAPDLVIGTPQYMSPEQCSESKAIDARSDIYSLGVILFEMLAGHVPFTGESATHVMMKHMTEPPPSVLALRSDLPVGISDVVAKALAKLPDDRFQSAGAMSDALFRATAGEDLTANRAGHGIAGSGQFPAAGTQPVEPVSVADDLDEVTLVRAPLMTSSAATVPRPAPASLNPWRIIVPSIIALLVVFAAVFLLTRNSGQTQSQQQTNQALTVDPNSQPVQAASPPTGESERGFQPNPVGTPGGGNAGANANQNADPLSGNLNDNSGANTNENQNSAGQGNKNANQARELPSPKSSPLVNMSAPPLPPGPKPSPEAPKPSPTVEQ